jgi:hypothetical protein
MMVRKEWFREDTLLLHLNHWCTGHLHSPHLSSKSLSQCYTAVQAKACPACCCAVRTDQSTTRSEAFTIVKYCYQVTTPAIVQTMGFDHPTEGKLA